MTSPAKGFSANSSVESRDNVCKAAVCSLLGNRSRKDGDGDGEGVVERIAILIYSYTHTHTISLLSGQKIWSLRPLLLSSNKSLAYKEFILYHREEEEEEEEILAENTVLWPFNNLHPPLLLLDTIVPCSLRKYNAGPLLLLLHTERAWIRTTSDKKA
jgi:hypothetical protein